MRSNIMMSKYRPKTLDDVIGQERVVSKLKRFRDAGRVPHLLFEGPAGTGKTTCAMAFMKELYGSNWKANSHRVNASDESGVDNIRKKVKNFCMTAPIDADFKIVFLDEVDYISAQSQAVLRRLMEDTSLGNRFFLSANYSYKIIDPIKDRCAICRFTLLSEDNIKEMLDRIEEVKIDNESKKLIASKSGGSMRKALNILESISIGVDEITIDHSREAIEDVISRDDISMIVTMIGKKDVKGLHEKIFELTRYKGISAWEIIHELLKSIEDSEMSDHIKMKMAMICGEVDYRITVGANPEIQLSCGFREMMDVL